MYSNKFGSMIDLLAMQKDFILLHLREGGIAVDFTMGNGHDTAFLSNTVGAAGHVYAFDIQPEAIVSTKKTLADEGCPDNVTLILDSHSNVRNYVSGQINAGMFNLGYMPGGDKKLTTLRETTMPAVSAAIELLAPGGALTVAVYPGHAEGSVEGNLLREYFTTLERSKICCTEIKIVNSPTSPYFTVIEKK